MERPAERSPKLEDIRVADLDQSVATPEELPQHLTIQPVHRNSDNQSDIMSKILTLYLPGKQFLEPGPDPIPGAATLENSATMLQMCSSGETSNRLRELMFRALDEDTRSRRLPFTGMKLAFLLFQHGIFYLLIAVAPTMVSIVPVWACRSVAEEAIFVAIIALTVSAGIVQTFTESSFVQTHEILQLSPFPSFDHLVKCEDCSLAVNSPPTRACGSFFLSIRHFQRFWAELRPMDLYRYIYHE